jgi:hypothetical protein
VRYSPTTSTLVVGRGVRRVNGSGRSSAKAIGLQPMPKPSRVPRAFRAFGLVLRRLRVQNGSQLQETVPTPSTFRLKDQITTALDNFTWKLQGIRFLPTSSFSEPIKTYIDNIRSTPTDIRDSAGREESTRFYSPCNCIFYSIGHFFQNRDSESQKPHCRSASESRVIRQLAA